MERIPIERLPTLELTRALARPLAMYGLLEVDVTGARGRMRAHAARTGQHLSFSAFLLTCLARAVDEQRAVQALRSGRRLVVFDQVDVATMVEVQGADGARFPLPYVVRDAAHKTVQAIHEEIRAAQTSSGLLDAARRQMRPLAYIPRPVRLLAWRLLARSARLRQRFGGTVLMTSVGPFTAGAGWGLAPLAYPVALLVGGIARQPVVHDGVLEERERLCLTVAVDHDVVDGAPAARFGARLRELIEQGAGLPTAEQTQTEEARADAATLRTPGG